MKGGRGRKVKKKLSEQSRDCSKLWELFWRLVVMQHLFVGIKIANINLYAQVTIQIAPSCGWCQRCCVRGINS